MEPTRRGRGRPPKPEGEVMTHRIMRWPPALWAELEELIPERQRSRFIRRAVEKALAQERRRREKIAGKVADQTWEAERRNFDSGAGQE